MTFTDQRQGPTGQTFRRVCNDCGVYTRGRLHDVQVWARAHRCDPEDVLVTSMARTAAR